MPNIYLKHPVHGAKIATMEMEAEFDEQNGWVRYNPDDLSSDEPQDTPNFLQVSRRGRPPKVKEA